MKTVILVIISFIISVPFVLNGQEGFIRYESKDMSQLSEVGIPEENYTDANVFGHVIDKNNGEHLPFMHLIIKNTSIGTATDETGHYLLVNVPEGEYILKAQAMGYKTREIKVTFEKGVSKEINFELAPDFINAEGVVVTANRNEVSRKDATNVVSVLESKMMEKTQSTNIAEGLNFQPGVRVENNCQNCGFTQLRMNGMEGPYTQILIDGHSVMSALSSVYGLEQIPASMVERVEVIRGGGSVLYGSNAIAGTVNVITKEPVKNSFQASATQGVISDGVTDNVISMNTSLVTDDFKNGLFLFAQHRDRDPYNANPEALWDADGDGIKETKDDFSEVFAINGTNFGLRAYHRINKRKKVSLEYHHLGEFRRGGNKFELPAHFADVAEQVRSRVNGGTFTYDYLSDNLRHDLSFYNSFQHVDRETYYGAEQDPNAYGHTTELTNITGMQYTGYLENLLFASATLSAGAEFKYSDLKDDKLNSGVVLPISRQEYDNMGVYTESEWDLKNAKVKLGIRADKNSLLDKIILSPRANFLLSLNSATQMRATYSQGFRAPQIFDEDLHIEVAGANAVRTMNSEDLTEERSQSFTLSFDNTSAIGEWQTYFMVDGFYTTLDDQFVKEIQQNDDGTAFLYRTNGQGAEVYGINFEGKIAPSENVTFSAGWTLQRSKYKEEEILWQSEDGSETVATNNILRTPDSYGYFLINAEPNHYWNLTLNGTYSGEMELPHLINPENEYTIIEKSNPYLDLGFRVERHLHIDKNVDFVVFTGMKNILNHYQNDFDAGINRDAGYVYGASYPRMIYFGVKLKN